MEGDRQFNIFKNTRSYKVRLRVYGIGLNLNIDGLKEFNR